MNSLLLQKGVCISLMPEKPPLQPRNTGVSPPCNIPSGTMRGNAVVRHVRSRVVYYAPRAVLTLLYAASIAHDKRNVNNTPATV